MIIKNAVRRLGFFTLTLTSFVMAFSSPALAALITVPGTSDPWLAGTPLGSTASGSDVAPDHSPVEVRGLGFSGGDHLSFTNARGGVSNGGGCPPGCSPIDGGAFFAHSAGSENGISDVVAPINSLVGVFLTGETSMPSSTPARLDFRAIGLNFSTLSPALNQVFFIGDGLATAEMVQQFAVPENTTRLFLGTMDGFGWFNNTGAITIDVAGSTTPPPSVPESIPEPSALLLFGVAAAGVFLVRLRKYNKAQYRGCM